MKTGQTRGHKAIVMIPEEWCGIVRFCQHRIFRNMLLCRHI